VNSKLSKNSNIFIDGDNIKLPDDGAISLNSSGVERILLNPNYTSILSPDGTQTTFNSTTSVTTLGNTVGVFGVSLGYTD
jgi:hypothetical protein